MDLSGRTLGEYILREERGDGESRERFLREARLAAQLRHPYAAQVYAFGAEDDGSHPGRARLARPFAATAANDHAPSVGRGLPRNVDLADPGLTSLRPASYDDCRTRHTHYVGESHQDWSAAKTSEPNSSRATDETADAGEVQANQELGFGRAGHA